VGPARSEAKFEDVEILVTSAVDSRDDMPGSIEEFLGKGW